MDVLTRKRTCYPANLCLLYSKKIDCLDWNSVLINYRNSPYFCLNMNNHILDNCNGEFPFYKNEDLEPICKNDDQSLVYFNAVPKKQYAKRLKASMCRELLKQINSLTLAVLEEEILGKLKESLKDTVKDLKLQAPYEAGLIKESSSSYVRCWSKKVSYQDHLPKSKI